MTLDDWLARIESCHPETIELGLGRINQVWQRLSAGLGQSRLAPTVITVAGTNGKGSTIELMHSIFQAAGFKTGVYTSPHLLAYNERVRLNGKSAEDQLLCDGFAAVEAAREDIPLTYFEYGTLCAFYVFLQQPLDVVLLEVGLGGRLDAVNLIDADIAVITAIGLDHQAWLGNDRDTIAREKAGVMRAKQWVVCSDLDRPTSIDTEAERIDARLLSINEEFGFQQAPDTEGLETAWQWQGFQLAEGHSTSSNSTDDLTPVMLDFSKQPQLPLANATAAIQAVLLTGLDVPLNGIEQAVLTAQLDGRYQRLEQPFPMLLDVAHNPQSAEYLAQRLATEQCQGKRYAVCGVLADKDSTAILTALIPYIDHWICVDLTADRAKSADSLKAELTALGIDGVECYGSVSKAMEVLAAKLNPTDEAVIFGSFYTVADALEVVKTQSDKCPTD